MANDQKRVLPHRRLSVRTADPDVAQAEVVRAFVDHEMSVEDKRALDFNLELAPQGRLTLARVRYGTHVRLFAPPMSCHYQVNLPISGTNTAQQNGKTRTSVAGESGIAMRPGSPLTVSWSPDNVQYAMKVPAQLLIDQAAKLTGHPVDDSLQFDLRFDLTSARGRALMATAGFLYDELTQPGGLTSMPGAWCELESALTTQMLMAIPSQLSWALHGKPSPTRRSRILELMEYIDTHPAEHLTTADLADRAGISARALQAGFQKVAGMSPRAYVRGVRLDHVHLELSSNGSATIADTAARWGFHHPGYFAQQFRDRFGALPSQVQIRE